MKNTVGDDESPTVAVGGLPGWARRHLTEADPDEVAPFPSTPRRHRHSRRREPSRLRGWALATAAVAVATGSVPLAVATLARDEVPMPRVDTFPVAAPADVELGTGSRPGPDLAATLPPITADDEPVVPTAQLRPLPAAARSDAPPERTRSAPVPPRRSTPATVTRTPPRPTGPEAVDPDDDREDTPRDGPTSTTTPTTTTTATEPSDVERREAPREPPVLDSAVGAVGARLLG